MNKPAGADKKALCGILGIPWEDLAYTDSYSMTLLVD